MAAEPRVRKSADERREDILAVALRHFAIGGLHGTSTEAIAREAGISQPYLFRLFHTKKELFLACVDRADGKVSDVFRRAAANAPAGERLQAMVARSDLQQQFALTRRLCYGCGTMGDLVGLRGLGRLAHGLAPPSPSRP